MPQNNHATGNATLSLQTPTSLSCPSPGNGNRRDEENPEPNFGGICFPAERGPLAHVNGPVGPSLLSLRLLIGRRGCRLGAGPETRRAARCSRPAGSGVRLAPLGAPRRSRSRSAVLGAAGVLPGGAWRLHSRPPSRRLRTREVSPGAAPLQPRLAARSPRAPGRQGRRPRFSPAAEDDDGRCWGRSLSGASPVGDAGRFWVMLGDAGRCCGRSLSGASPVSDAGRFWVTLGDAGRCRVNPVDAASPVPPL